jgi:hypothetical protein
VLDSTRHKVLQSPTTGGNTVAEGTARALADLREMRSEMARMREALDALERVVRSVLTDRQQ